MRGGDFPTKQSPSNFVGNLLQINDCPALWEIATTCKDRRSRDDWRWFVCFATFWCVRHTHANYINRVDNRRGTIYRASTLSFKRKINTGTQFYTSPVNLLKLRLWLFPGFGYTSQGGFQFFWQNTNLAYGGNEVGIPIPSRYHVDVHVLGNAGTCG